MKIKRLLLAVSIVFALAVCLGISVSAETYSGGCGGSVGYTLDTDTGVLTISGMGDMENYEYESIFGQRYADYIKIIEISDGITSIGNYAFKDCVNLTRVTIPNSVISIGVDAFRNCGELTNVSLGNGVTSLGNYAFENCYKLTSVIIPNSVTSIGKSVFGECSSLTSIAIPNSVTSIGYGAFFNCAGLTDVTIGNGVSSIANDVFYGCSSLTSFNVDEENAFYASKDGVLYNKGLTSLIEFPDGKSGDYVIPDGVTSVMKDAFKDCAGLTGITIPSSVTSIGDSAFYSCISLISIKVDEENAYFASKNDVLFNKELTLLILFPKGKIGDYVIPGSVTSISEYAFENCDKLANVIIPNSVTSIEKFAFISCNNLTSVTIPVSITSIGSRAFHDCNNITDVYYLGDEEAWRAISVGTYGNNMLLGANIHFNTPPKTVVSDFTIKKWGTLWLIKIQAENLPQSYEVYVASYKDNGEFSQLVSIKLNEKGYSETSMTFNGEKNFKLFIWSDLKTVKPLSDVETYQWQESN